MTIWFLGWILILFWGQSKEQELAAELLAKSPCSCGTEQYPHEKIWPALHLAGWMMLCPSATPEAALNGTQSHSRGKAPPPVLTDSHKSYPLARATLAHPFWKADQRGQRWIGVKDGEDRMGIRGAVSCGIWAVVEDSVLQTDVPARAEQHPEVQSRAELLAQSHHSVNSFGAGLGSCPLHAGDGAQVQQVPFSPCHNETGLEAENCLSTFWAITTTSGN